MNKPAAPKKPGSMTGLRTGPRARAALERAYRARAQQAAEAPREGASPRRPRDETADRGEAPARPRRTENRGEGRDFGERRPQERRRPEGEGFRGRPERAENDREGGRGRPRGEFRGERGENAPSGPNSPDNRFPRERGPRAPGGERNVAGGPRTRSNAPGGDARPRREGDAPEYPRRPREGREGRPVGDREERPRGGGFGRPQRDERERSPRYEDDGRHGHRSSAPRPPGREDDRPDRPPPRERAWARDRTPEGEARGRAERPRSEEPRQRPVEGVRGAYERRARSSSTEERPARAWQEDAPRKPRAPVERRPVEHKPASAPRDEAAQGIASPRASSAEGVRVSKLMTEQGLCSRREADEYIERGWVFADGEKVKELGTRVRPEAEITLSPKAEKVQFERVTILMHKPVGVVSGQAEDDYAPAISLINEESQYRPEGGPRFKPQHLKHLAPAGRLDIDSTGLLVLTQDGRIAKLLVGEQSKVEKEYLVRVEGRLVEGGLELLNHGLELDGKPLRPAKVSWQNEDQLRFALREGRKRQVRRMCELVGLRVVGLKRVRIGRVMLSDLPLGQWRYLREDEQFD
ncbi:pseudouridine synthase [Niveibacterium sp. SC-1]|uniref:pseudouridine synthase n=1 Tax=Niveibacterium sp. SC-1 TaxID=3135646 RepID=UPI00311D66F0